MAHVAKSKTKALEAVGAELQGWRGREKAMEHASTPLASQRSREIQEIEMFERYKARIERYCEREGIEIPVGFYRHDIGRYVAISLESNPPRLVATTWTNETDAIRYSLGPGAGQALKLLDFKEHCEVRFNGGNVLVRGDPL